MQELHLLHNPNPIKLNEQEQEAMDEIAKNLLDLIFGKWAKSKPSVSVGAATIFDKNVMFQTFGQKPRPIRVIVKGVKKTYNKFIDTFGFTSGAIHTWPNGKQEININLNGYGLKKSFSDLYKNNPYVFFIEYIGFLSTIRHEFIHAKDPNASNRYGTGVVNKKFGYMHYINDPARLEMRSHLGEWDILLSEIQSLIANKDKNEYTRGVWTEIERVLCVLQHNFAIADDKAEALFKFLTMKKDLYTPFVPKVLAERLKLNHDFYNEPYDKVNKAITLYEDAKRAEWTDLFVKKDGQYKKILRERRRIEKVLIEDSKKVKEYKNRAELMDKVKEYMKTNAPTLPKKPVKKVYFTREERQNILDNRKNNYPDMIQAIYTMFRDKGLLDPKLCDAKLTVRETVAEKRAGILPKRDKIVIYSLMNRFQNMR